MKKDKSSPWAVVMMTEILVRLIVWPVLAAKYRAFDQWLGERRLDRKLARMETLAPILPLIPDPVIGRTDNTPAVDPNDRTWRRKTMHPETGEVKEFMNRVEADKAGFTIALKRPPKSNCRKCHGRGYIGKDKAGVCVTCKCVL